MSHEVAPHWRKVDIAGLQAGQEIGGIEQPADWDLFGRQIGKQMLAIFYTGDSGDIEGIPNTEPIRGYGSVEAATALERQVSIPVLTHAYKFETFRLVYLGAVDYLPGRARDMLRKRPSKVDAPLVNEARFAGALTLRSRLTDEVIGVTGVSFGIDLEDVKRSKELVTAIRRVSPGGPTFASTAKELYPGTRPFGE